MGQDGEGRFVEAWKRVAEGLVGTPVCLLRAFEVGFVLGQCDVFTVGACLLLLQRVAAALVALVVDLVSSQLAGCRSRVQAHLGILTLLHRLVHGLQGILGQPGRDDELPFNVFDFLHHVRLELCEGLLQRRDALQRRLGCLNGNMGAQAGLLRAQWLENGVEVLDCGQLVVEDVGPGVAPLLGRLFELRWSVVACM